MDLLRAIGAGVGRKGEGVFVLNEGATGVVDLLGEEEEEVERFVGVGKG